MGEQSDAFLASFASRKRDIARQIGENLDWKELLVKITALRKEFAEATAILPSYESRQCEIQLKELERQIEAIRTTSSTKSRFTFKRSTVVSTKAEEPNVVPLTASTVVLNELAPSPSQLSISKRRNTLLTVDSIDVKPPSLPGQSSLLLADLESCVVDLLSPSKETPSLTINALHVRSLKNVILISGYISGSVLLHDCEDCLLILGCQQFRMHTSKNTAVQLYVRSRPVIEHSTGISIAPYSSSSFQGNDQFPSDPSQHYSVQDFDWIKSTPSPNWTRANANDAALSKIHAFLSIFTNSTSSRDDAAVRELLLNILPPLQQI